MDKLRTVLERCVEQSLVRLIISNPRNGEKKTKIEIRPFEQKGILLYQCAEYKNKQVFHKNISAGEMVSFCMEKADD